MLNTFGPLPQAQAQELVLPQVGTRIALSPEFLPPILKGIVIHPENPLQLDFLIHKGETPLADEQKKEEYNKIIKYFLASLTIPEKNLWVNLSPYEKQRVIPTDFAQTEMGRDLLGQDYILKQITASLIYPEDEFGKKFWKKIYEQAQQKFGTTNIPVNTFNKVWIIPNEATVYEHENTVLIVHSKMKVMLEEDYLALEKGTDANSAVRPILGQELVSVPNKDINALGSQIVREIVLPALEKEVNEGKNFAQLRQINEALILATWYKKALKESLLGKVYVDKAKVKGVQYMNSVIPAKAGIQSKGDIEGIYQQYLRAFKKGVFNYIKEDVDPGTNEIIPRKYFSGGYSARFDPVQGSGLDKSLLVKNDQTIREDSEALAGVKRFDEAMINNAVDQASVSLTTLKDAATQNKAQQALPVSSKTRTALLQEQAVQDELVPVKVKYDEEGSLLKIKDGKNLHPQDIQRLLTKLQDGMPQDLTDATVIEALFGEDQRERTLDLVQLASFIRDNFDYRLNNDDPRPPLRYGIENGLYFKIGHNLYISPTTESFRRHFIFKTNDEGDVLFAKEFMIPGDRKRLFVDKTRIGGEVRKKVADNINRRFPGGGYSVEIPYVATIANANIALHQSKPMQTIEIAVYDYRFDGKRLSHLTPEMKNQWARRMGVPIEKLERIIVEKALESMVAPGEMGYFTNGDGHTENARINNGAERLEDIKVQLVGDFEAYTQSRRWYYKVIIATTIAGAVGFFVPVMYNVQDPSSFILSSVSFLPLLSYVSYNNSGILFNTQKSFRGLVWQSWLSPIEIAKLLIKARKSVALNMTTAPSSVSADTAMTVIEENGARSVIFSHVDMDEETKEIFFKEDKYPVDEVRAVIEEMRNNLREEPTAGGRMGTLLLLEGLNANPLKSHFRLDEEFPPVGPWPTPDDNLAMVDSPENIRMMNDYLDKKEALLEHSELTPAQVKEKTVVEDFKKDLFELFKNKGFASFIDFFKYSNTARQVWYTLLHLDFFLSTGEPDSEDIIHRHELGKELGRTQMPKLKIMMFRKGLADNPGDWAMTSTPPSALKVEDKYLQLARNIYKRITLTGDPTLAIGDLLGVSFTEAQAFYSRVANGTKVHAIDSIRAMIAIAMEGADKSKNISGTRKIFYDDPPSENKRRNPKDIIVAVSGDEAWADKVLKASNDQSTGLLTALIGIALQRKADAAMNAVSVEATDEEKYGSEFDLLMKDEIERMSTFADSSYVPEVVEAIKVRDIFLADKGPRDGSIYIMESTANDRYLVLVDSKGHLIRVAVDMRPGNSFEIFDMKPAHGINAKFVMLSKRLNPLFEDKIKPILEEASRGQRTLEDKTLEYGTVRYTDKHKAKIFLPFLNPYYDIADLRNDFINNSLARHYIKQLGPRLVFGFDSTVRMVATNKKYVEAISFGGHTMYDVASYKSIDYAPLHHLELITHEFAHEHFRKLGEDAVGELTQYFKEERAEVASTIRKGPVYGSLNDQELADEAVAHIVGHLTRGYIHIYVRDGNRDKYNAPIKVNDIDVLIKHGYLPGEFEPSDEERQRFQKSEGNIDEQYLARVYPPSVDAAMMTVDEILATQKIFEVKIAGAQNPDDLRQLYLNGWASLVHPDKFSSAANDIKEQSKRSFQELQSATQIKYDELNGTPQPIDWKAWQSASETFGSLFTEISTVLEVTRTPTREQLEELLRLANAGHLQFVPVSFGTNVESKRQPNSLGTASVDTDQALVAVKIKVPRPQGKRINPEAAKAFVDAHPEDMRPFAQFVVDNVTRITQDDFEHELRRALSQFQAKIGDKPYVSIQLRDTGGGLSDVAKSNEWVHDLAVEFNMFKPQASVLRDDVWRWLIQNPEVNDIVIMDDGAYSGVQIGKLIATLVRAATNDEGLRKRVNALRFHVVVPYMTNRAKDWINDTRDPYGSSVSPHISFYSPQVISSMGELLRKAEKVIGYNRVNDFREIIENITKASLYSFTLTYFDHKVPDAVSVLSGEWSRANETILQGIVFNRDGTMQDKRVPFIDNINELPPYKTEMYKRYQKSRAGEKIEYADAAMNADRSVDGPVLKEGAHRMLQAIRRDNPLVEADKRFISAETFYNSFTNADWTLLGYDMRFLNLVNTLNVQTHRLELLSGISEKFGLVKLMSVQFPSMNLSVLKMDALRAGKLSPAGYIYKGMSRALNIYFDQTGDKHRAKIKGLINELMDIVPLRNNSFGFQRFLAERGVSRVGEESKRFHEKLKTSMAKMASLEEWQIIYVSKWGLLSYLLGFDPSSQLGLCVMISLDGKLRPVIISNENQSKASLLKTMYHEIPHIGHRAIQEAHSEFVRGIVEGHQIFEERETRQRFSEQDLDEEFRREIDGLTPQVESLPNLYYVEAKFVMALAAFIDKQVGPGRGLRMIRQFVRDGNEESLIQVLGTNLYSVLCDFINVAHDSSLGEKIFIYGLAEEFFLKDTNVALNRNMNDWILFESFLSDVYSTVREHFTKISRQGTISQELSQEFLSGSVKIIKDSFPMDHYDYDDAAVRNASRKIEALINALAERDAAQFSKKSGIDLNSANKDKAMTGEERQSADQAIDFMNVQDFLLRPYIPEGIRVWAWAKRTFVALQAQQETDKPPKYYSRQELENAVRGYLTAQEGLTADLIEKVIKLLIVENLEKQAKRPELKVNISEEEKTGLLNGIKNEARNYDPQKIALSVVGKQIPVWNPEIIPELLEAQIIDDILFKLTLHHSLFKDSELEEIVKAKSKEVMQLIVVDDPLPSDPDWGALKMRPADQASVATPGGIDLNSANMDLQIKRDGKGVPLPMQFQDMEKLQSIEGFMPVIIKIVPVTSMPFLSQLHKSPPTQALASAS